MNKILLGFLMILFVFSCKEERYIVPITTVKNEKAALFLQLLPQGERFRIEPDENSSLVTPFETIIQIPAFAFVDKDGNQLQETVTIDLLEVNTFSDIIRCNSNSISEDYAMSPIMQFEIVAKIGEKEIFLDSNKFITLRIEEDNPSSYTSLFLGDFDIKKGIKWKEDSNMDNLKLKTWVKNNVEVSGYELDIYQMGWISIQSKVSDLSTISLSVVFDTEFDSENTVVFVIDKSNNSVIPMYFNLEQHGFYSALIPKDKPVEIIAMSKSGNNQYYFKKMEIQLNESESFKINLDMVSFDELIELLN